MDATPSVVCLAHFFLLSSVLRPCPSCFRPSCSPLPLFLPPPPSYIVNTTFSALCIENAYEDSAKFHPAFNRTYSQWVDPESYCATANLLWWIYTIVLDVLVLILSVFGSNSSSSSSSSSSSRHNRFSPMSSSTSSDYTDDLIKQQEITLYIAYGIPGGILAVLLCLGCSALSIFVVIRILAARARS